MAKSEIDLLRQDCHALIKNQGELGLQYMQVEAQISEMNKKMDKLDATFQHYLPRSEFTFHVDDIKEIKDALKGVIASLVTINTILAEKGSVKRFFMNMGKFTAFIITLLIGGLGTILIDLLHKHI